MACRFETCPCTPWKASTEGYCYGHHQKMEAEKRKASQPPVTLGRPRTNPPVCKTPECNKPAIAKGLCSNCYQRMRRNYG